MKEQTLAFGDIQLDWQTEVEKWTTSIRKSDTNIKDIRQFDLLQETADRFVPVDVTATDDHFLFEFHIDPAYETWTQVKKRNRNERLRLLSNIQVFFHNVPARLTFFLHPNNLVFDENLLPRIVYRGMQGLLPPMEMSDSNLLKQYKCLAIAMFSEQYTFDQLYNGSLSKSAETAFEKKVNEIDSMAGLIALLKESYQQEQATTDKTMQLVPAKRFRLFKWLAISLIAVAVLLAVPLGYLLLMKQPFEHKLLEAHRNNLAADYDGVITSLHDVNPEKLSKPAKYILAYAYVKTEQLSYDEKQVIMKNISLKSNTDYLLYWIYNGRGEFEESIDLAKILNAPRLIMYGLIKKIERDKQDTTLSGEERDEAVRKAEDELQKYREKYGLEKESEDNEISPETPPAKQNEEKPTEDKQKEKEKQDSKKPSVEEKQDKK